MQIESVAECRYRGQSFEIPAPIPGGRITQRTLSAIRDRFEAQHEAVYGHRDPDSPVIAAALRVSAVRPSDPVTLRETLARSPPADRATGLVRRALAHDACAASR